jgi:DEAD/DEAH box helicase domain-containing protein
VGLREEVEKRRRAAAEEPFGFTPAGAGHEVVGGSGNVYRVLPDLTGLPATCDCPDFRSGRAGTCKHVEAVRLHVAGRKPSVWPRNQVRAAPGLAPAGPAVPPGPAAAPSAGPEVLVFDLETQRAFDEVAGRRADLLGLSLGVVYSYRDDAFTTYFEDDAPSLIERLKAAALVVGFNHKRFDLEVLRPYPGGAALGGVRSFDLLEDLHRRLGHRVGLDGCARATLGAAKSGHGLEAIAWFRAGRFEELERYCRDDVRLTRDLFDHGRRQGFVVIERRDGRGGFGPFRVPVDWARAWPAAVRPEAAAAGMASGAGVAAAAAPGMATGRPEAPPGGAGPVAIRR